MPKPHPSHCPVTGSERVFFRPAGWQAFAWLLTVASKNLMELKRQIASARGQITKLCLSLTVDPNDKSIAVRLEAGSEKLSALLAQRDERLIRLYGNDEYDDEGELINVSSTAANNA